MATNTELTSAADKPTFAYRILIVDDEEMLRVLGAQILEAQGYQVLSAADGLLGLAALKESLPDIIISDLSMPNMDGFEFLSVVRRRFPLIPVIAISGEFTGLSVPESVLADAFFSKGQYRLDELFATIIELLHELPTRPRAGKPSQAAVWAKNDKGTVTVSCSDCLRTFPVNHVDRGDNEAECIFCGGMVHFEIIGERRMASGASVSDDPSHVAEPSDSVAFGRPETERSPASSAGPASPAVRAFTTEDAMLVHEGLGQNESSSLEETTLEVVLPARG